MYEMFLGIIKNKNILNSNLEEDEFIDQPALTEIKYYENFFIYWDNLTPSEHFLKMTDKEEKFVRIFCNSIIQESGIILKLPQVVMLTAMNIFNRFYWKYSFIHFEPFHMLCSSLFLATKIEETYRRMRDVISCCYHILIKKSSKSKSKDSLPPIIDVSSEFYEKMKENIMKFETYILKEFGFTLYELSLHPHKYLLHFTKLLKGNKELFQRSWNYLNDMYRCSLSVNYPPHVLACSSLFLANRVFSNASLSNIPHDLQWWEIFDTSIMQIQEVCAEVLHLYEDFSNINIDSVRAILKTYSSFREEILNEERLKIAEKKQKEDEEKNILKNKRVREEKERLEKRQKRRSSSRSDSNSSRRRHKRKHKKSKHKHKKKRRQHSSSRSSSSYSNSYSGSDK
jgi:hypothetical protein